MVFAGLDISINFILGASIISLAIITILIGTLMLFRETRLKKLLLLFGAVELGYIFIAVGIGIFSSDTSFGLFALKGGVFHFINAGLGFVLLIQASLCFSYSTKATSFAKLEGLARDMKYTSIFFILGFLTVIGIPPLSGFASKLLIYESVYQINPILSVIAVICSILLLSIFVKVLITNFIGVKHTKSKEVKEVPKSMLYSMGLISTIIVIFSIFPKVVLEFIVQPIVDALINRPNYISQINELENGEIFWTPIIWLCVIIIALIVIFIIRGVGKKEAIEKTKSTKSKKMSKKPLHAFWDFTESLIWTYNVFEKKILDRNLSDYIITITLLLSLVFILIGVI